MDDLIKDNIQVIVWEKKKKKRLAQTVSNLEKRKRKRDLCRTVSNLGQIEKGLNCGIEQKTMSWRDISEVYLITGDRLGMGI